MWPSVIRIVAESWRLPFHLSFVCNEKSTCILKAGHLHELDYRSYVAQGVSLLHPLDGYQFRSNIDKICCRNLHGYFFFTIGHVPPIGVYVSIKPLRFVQSMMLLISENSRNPNKFVLVAK
jgi:hypothetical protein